MIDAFTLSEAERIRALEVQVADIHKQQATINSKLDDLLALRNKGLGAFWLASSLIGTGIIGLIVQFVGWIKHG